MVSKTKKNGDKMEVYISITVSKSNKNLLFRAVDLKAKKYLWELIQQMSEEGSKFGRVENIL